MRRQEVGIRYRFLALLFFSMVGIIELADFAGQVSTMADTGRIMSNAASLGIEPEAARTRMTLLVPLAAVIAAVALSVAYGAVVGDSRRHGRILVAFLLAIYAGFQLVSGLLLAPSELLLAALFAVLAAGAYLFVRLAPEPSMREREV